MSVAPEATPSRQLNLRFVNKREFLGRYLPDVGFGGYQLASDPIDTGTILSLSVSMVGFTERYELLGKVVWRHSQPPMRTDLAKGVGVEFLPECREALKALLAFCASDQTPDAALRPRDDRHDARLPVTLECEYLYEDHMIRERVSDISVNGLFIQTERGLPTGQDFVFFLHDSALIRPLVMSGRVVWNEGRERQGFGVELVFDSRKHQHEYRQFVTGQRDANGGETAGHHS